MMKNKVIIIFGPTSSGKTALSIRLAKYIWGKYNIESEIISADSRQVYIGMNVATNKPDLATQKEVKHHLINIADPDAEYDKAQFHRDTIQKLNEIHRAGRLPIIVGGTGTFILDIFGDDYLIKTRERRKKSRYDSLMLIPEYIRPRLYKRIEKNVDNMFHNGLYKEIKKLTKNGEYIPAQLKKTLGYSEFIDYCKNPAKKLNNLDRVDLAKIRWKIKANTKRYAMHQDNLVKKLKGYVRVEDFDLVRTALERFFAPTPEPSLER